LLRHSFYALERFRQQGAKSVNGPSFVCLYIPWLDRTVFEKLSGSQTYFSLFLSQTGPYFFS
jgi:hypothetical protein